MDSLQKALEKALAAIPEQMFAKLIRHKLAEQGITITQRRSEMMIGELRKGKTHLKIPGKRTGMADLWAGSSKARHRIWRAIRVGGSRPAYQKANTQRVAVQCGC